MPDRDEIEKLAVWLFTDVPTNWDIQVGSWDGLTEQNRNDYREAAEKLLANFVPRTEHEKAMEEQRIRGYYEGCEAEAADE